MRSSMNRPKNRRRPTRFVKAGLAGALALASAFPVKAAPKTIHHPELVLHTLNLESTAPKDFFSNVLNARLKLKIKNAKSVNQKIQVLEDNLSERDKAYLNLLIEREIQANPVMADLNRQLLETRSSQRRLKLALWSAGLVTPSLLLGAFLLGHRRGRKTKPRSYGWPGLH